MIGSLRIENYKVIKNLELDLGPLNVLVGPNGAGKTAIVEVLQIFQHMANPGFSFESDLPRIFMLVATGGFSGALRSGGDIMTLGFSAGEGLEFTCAFALGERGNPKITNLSSNGEWVPLWDCRVLRSFVQSWHLHKFRDVYALGRDHTGLFYAPGHNDVYLSGAGENLPQVLLGLKIRNEATYNRIRGIFLAAIEDQAPEADLSLEARPGTIVSLNVEMSKTLWGSAWSLSYRDWPDGWKKFLALIVSLETATSLFVIEEPENYLHPGLINYFMDLVKERVKEGLQVIITTHSPVLVNLISDMPDSLIMMDNGRAARVTEKDKDYLRKINKLLGTAYFGGLLDGPGNS